jgi:Xaa-Pro aminopeptidase
MKNLKSLKKRLKLSGNDYYLINSSDEFLNEYVSESEMKLRWLTNFSGSNGMALIGLDDQYFFTDGRYTQQAEKELDKSFAIFDSGRIDFFEFMYKRMKQKKILLDTKTFRYDFLLKLKKNLAMVKSALKHDKKKIMNTIWDKKPTFRPKKFFQLKKKFHGMGMDLKHKKIFKLSDKDVFIITSPDSACWFLNIRGYDLPNSPLIFCRLIIKKNFVDVFVDKEKVPENFEDKKNIIKFYDIDLFDEHLKNLEKNQRILLDKNSSFYIYSQLKINKLDFEVGTDPCTLLKSKKNTVEIKQSKCAHLLDGISLTKFYSWLDNQKSINNLTEYSVAQKLEEFRRQSETFFSLSFPTISAVGRNGSIIHYKPEIKECSNLKNGELFLCDSGAQYYGGTTDVTRTIILGNKKPKKEYIKNYTNVLIGHLDLSMLKFPIGTKGFHIDSIARTALWRQGLDYNHGTGHGVGSFLNVHEGPQSISKSNNNFELKEGMILSNEPGFYKNGCYGIRIENLVLIKKSHQKNFLEFDCLTLFPFEDKLIDHNMLEIRHRVWIKDYYRKIKNEIIPFINKFEREWLIKKIKKFL